MQVKAINLFFYRNSSPVFTHTAIINNNNDEKIISNHYQTF